MFLSSFDIKRILSGMKGFYRRLFLISFLVLGVVVFSKAQRSNGLTVEGKISVQQGSVEGAVIQMFQDGRRLDDYGVGSDGKYKVELNYNHKFELVFMLKGNFSQKIVVDATVPKAVLNSDPLFPPFPVNINLFTEIAGIDKSFSENTVLKIYYSEQVDNFISDLYYNDAQIKKLIDQAILQSQLINKEADYLSKLTKAELAELRKEYDQLLKDADAEYGNEKFLNALDGYKAANQVFPNEQYPKDRIAEINDLLGLMMVAEEMDKALADRFNTLIAGADRFFGAKQYFEARNSYNRALSIRPSDSHANQRVKEINDILKAQQTEQDYQDLIVRGNNAFNEMLYDEALKIYTEASALRPNEEYPKTKIREINDKLGQMAKNLENQKNYEQAIFQAEMNFEKQFYDKSLASYENALSYKPGDTKATAKIAEIKDLMNRLANRTLYDKFIDSADKSYKKELLQDALADYKKALELFPDEEYPLQRVQAINEKLNSEAAFLAAVQKADQAFDTKQYPNAKNLYTQVLGLRSNDKHSSDRIIEIDRILATVAVDDQYNSLITEADQMFSGKSYNEAKSKYTEALGLKSKEQYPKDKINEITVILRDLAALDQKYQQAVTKADNLFKGEKYDDAKTAFTEAGNLKPAETYPPEMIARINSLLDEQTRLLAQKEAQEKARLEAAANERDKNYQSMIDEADRLAAINQLVDAVGKFRSALDIKPNEQYPIKRIEEIRGIIARQQEIQNAYNAAVAKGDSEFKKEAFPTSKAAFINARATKPDESYPGEMIAKIDSIVETRARLAKEAADAETARLAALQAEKDRQYNEAITKADGLFTGKEYENARTEYRSALNIKPEEKYPQQKIDEIGTLLAQLSAAQKAYEDAVAIGDREFKREGFDAAKTAYNTAKSAKSDESYPGEMIAKIDSIVETRARLAKEAADAETARLAALQAEKDREYNEAITKADGLFTGKEYENARTEYRSALNIKPEEKYPQQKIDEIGTLLAQLSAAQKAYEDAVAIGDREFKREGFDAAKTAYNTAKSAKSDESYPGEMIAKIDSIVETRARLAKEAADAETARLAALQAEKDRQYNEAITKADGLFTGKEYENARTEYCSALNIKPEEKYPQQKIDEIGTLLAQLSAAQKAYEDAVAIGDREFKREGFDAAKTAYNTAKSAKSDESYPGEMIAKIDSIVETRARLAKEAADAETARLAALQAEKDREYNEAITKADGLFTGKEYENARTEYRSALNIKPEEKYPQQKIDEIGTLLAQLSAAQKAYEDAVAIGDREFKREGFDAAKTAYNTAKSAKSDESYPGEMIAKIDSIVETRARLAKEAADAETARLAALQAEKDRQYNEAIAKADGLFTGKEYENARTEYRSALNIKPEEKYPQQRIDEINTIIEQLATAQREMETQNRNYENAIQVADNFFKLKNYIQARTNYEKASGIKPEEEYPKQKIVEADAFIAQQKADEEYRNVILAADGFFKTTAYTEAKTEYEKALTIKSNELYPKSQIQKINDIFQKEQERILLEQQAAADLERRRFEIQQQNESEREQEIVSQAGLDDLYNEYIGEADKFFGNKQYNVSRSWYYKALDVKPEETYPSQRIGEINRLLSGLLSSQRDRDYQNYVNLADSTFRTNQLAVARGWYNRALSVKSDEPYPKEQLNEIQRLISERLAGQSGELFNSQVEKASAAYDSGNFTVARFWYKKALELRPDDADVKNRLKEIEEKLK